MAPTITFDQIERNADLAYAYALLARLAKNYLVAVYRLREVSNSLRDLLAVLTPDRVEWLARDSSDNAARLRCRIEDLHTVLCGFSRSEQVGMLGKSPLPIVPGLVSGIQDMTEDLGDIVENIALSRSDDFRNLVSCCADAVGIQIEEVVGRMHD